MGDFADEDVVGGDDTGVAETAFERCETRRRSGGSRGAREPSAGRIPFRAENAASSRECIGDRKVVMRERIDAEKPVFQAGARPTCWLC